MSNPLVDHRFELLDELPHVTGGRLFRARDRAFSEMVGVKELGTNCGLDVEARNSLHNMIRHLQCLPHPNLTRIHVFDAARGLIVQEWVTGISLLDLLRRRRELSVSEAVRLLAPLPATLDFMAQQAVPIPRPLLAKIYIEVDDGAAEKLAREPLHRWPSFRLKLNPVSLRGLVAESSDDPATVVADPRTPEEIQEGYGPRELALLLYELLGGRIREAHDRRYSPLSCLGEAGNTVLRRELLAMPHRDCQSLWHELLLSQPHAVVNLENGAPEKASAPVRSRIPPEFLGSAHPGFALLLATPSEEIPPIQLIARPRFTVGRSVGVADFVTRILPENSANNARTNRLSRVHAFLEWQEGQIVVRDGNGTGPSLNGAYLDGQALAPQHPALLQNRARLVLADEYALDVIPLSSKETPEWEIENISAWQGPPDSPAGLPYRALVCEPADGHATTRSGVWLFSEIGFGLDALNRVVWDTRETWSSPAAFHFFRGCFWLRNETFPSGTLLADNIPLKPGEVVPLAPGQTIRIGGHDFSVTEE